MPSSDPVVVLGTGRCGSTVLARLLGTLPGFVTLGEFLSSIAPCELSADAMLDARAFGEFCRRPRSLPSLLFETGLEPAEYTYPVDRAGSRWTRTTGIPPMLVTTLPLLVDDPDTLFDEILATVSTGPERTLATHLRRLADVITEAVDATTFVEQSGGSLVYAELVRAVLPDARIVHLVRDGRDSSWSSSHHASFRMAYVQAQLAEEAGHDPLAWSPATAGELRDGFEDRYGLLDAASLQEKGAPLDWFARSWSGLMMTAAARLAGADVHTVAYEHLVREPMPTLRAIAGFLDVEPDPEWLTATAAELRPDRIGVWEAASEADQRTLAFNCRPGNRAREALLAS